MINAYRDLSGETGFNDALAARRADAVATYLRIAGVPPGVIQTLSLGSAFASRTSRQDAASRRVEIRFQEPPAVQPAQQAPPEVVRPQFRVERPPLATRFRDLRPIIESTLTLAFLSSPIIWSPEMINPDSTIMRLNPLTHLFAAWREPLATGHVAMTSVVYVLVCLPALALASVVTIIHLRRAAFWI